MKRGGDALLTPQVDVYAFAIVCVEVLGNGKPPWPDYNDGTIRARVLSKVHYLPTYFHSSNIILLLDNRRPTIPHHPEVVLMALPTLIEQCWSELPTSRPSFNEIIMELKRFIGGSDSALLKPSPSPLPKIIGLPGQGTHQSPDIRPEDIVEPGNFHFKWRSKLIKLLFC